jgi:hypothetical protein
LVQLGNKVNSLLQFIKIWCIMVFVFMKGKIYYEIIKRHTRNIKELWEY